MAVSGGIFANVTRTTSTPALLNIEPVPEVDPLLKRSGTGRRGQREAHVVLALLRVGKPLRHGDEISGGVTGLGEVGPDVGHRERKLAVDRVVREESAGEEVPDVVKVARACRRMGHRWIGHHIFTGET